MNRVRKLLICIVGIIICLSCILLCNNCEKTIVAKLIVAQDCKTDGIPDGWEYNEPLRRLIYFKYMLANHTSDTLFVPLGFYHHDKKCKSSLSIIIRNKKSIKPKLYDVFCSGTRIDNILYPGDSLFLSFVMTGFVNNEEDSLSTLDLVKLIQNLDIKFKLDSNDVTLNHHRIPEIQFDNDTANAKIFRSVEEAESYFEKNELPRIKY